jgi:hypothetical protein
MYKVQKNYRKAVFRKKMAPNNRKKVFFELKTAGTFFISEIICSVDRGDIYIVT